MEQDSKETSTPYRHWTRGLLLLALLTVFTGLGAADIADYVEADVSPGDFREVNVDVNVDLPVDVNNLQITLRDTGPFPYAAQETTKSGSSASFEEGVGPPPCNNLEVEVDFDFYGSHYSDVKYLGCYNGGDRDPRITSTSVSNSGEDQVKVSVETNVQTEIILRDTGPFPYAAQEDSKTGSSVSFQEAVGPPPCNNLEVELPETGEIKYLGCYNGGSGYDAHEYTSCNNGDYYWYDSNGDPTDRIDSCGSNSGWSSCSYGSTCDESGSRSRTIRGCRDSSGCYAYSDSQSCSRNTDGNSCGNTADYCSSGSCQSICGRSTCSWNTQSCGGGSCAGYRRQQTESCSDPDCSQRSRCARDLSCDSDPPSVSVTNAPDSWTNSVVTAHVTASDDEYGLQERRIKVYSSNPGSCPSDWSAYTAGAATDITTHSWVCGAAMDEAGNVAYTGSATEFLVDRAAPDTANTSDNQWHRLDQTVRLSCADAGGSGCSGTTFCVDQEDSCTPGRSGTTVTVSTEGHNFLRYRSTDVAGNVEPVESTPVKIDRTPPTASCNDCMPDEAATGATVTIGPSVSDPDAGVRDVTLCTDSQCTDILCSGSPCNATFDQTGTKNVWAQVIDRVGNSNTVNIGSIGVKLPVGKYCTADSDCLSGSCTDNSCSPQQEPPIIDIG